ncbi:uncharacterized protein LOC109833482 [Asparagus officinalis]|uniref:uncharacterized protein LOC109833482 n=1 Tax=Asparagus officinalis TaxID=4686 RepID=UPI00098E5E3C|nr:uncharacterized protein LOC109833482 [Asparagus officinalis]
MQVPQIMNLGHLRSDGSLPLTLKTTTAELVMPTFGVLHAAKGINLNADKTKLRIGPDQRKRKEPSNSGSKNILRNTADGGPSKLPYFTVASPLKGGLASQTASISCREAELPENSRTLNVTSHLKKVSVAKDAAWQSTTDDGNGKAALKDANVQHRGEIYSSTAQQYSLDGNQDKNDQRKIGPGTTAMEGPVQIDSFTNQQFKQGEGDRPGNSEIHHPAKEMKDENNATKL